MPSIPSSSPPPPAASSKLGDRLTAEQLGRINKHLDNLLRALCALTDLDEAAWTEALNHQSFSSAVAKTLMPDFQRSTGDRTVAPVGKNTAEIETIRGLVEVISYLASQFQEILRRSVTLMEQSQSLEKDLTKTRLLAEYLQKFQHLSASTSVSTQESKPPLNSAQSLGLLTELLFYSSRDGPRRLWDVLLITAQNWVYEAGQG